MMRPRSWSCNAPETISAAEAEGQHLQVGGTGFGPKRVLHALAVDLIPDHGKGEVVGSAFARDRDFDLGSARTLEQVGDLRGVQVFRRLIVYHHDDVAGP